MALSKALTSIEHDDTFSGDEPESEDDDVKMIEAPKPSPKKRAALLMFKTCLVLSFALQPHRVEAHHKGYGRELRQRTLACEAVHAVVADEAGRPRVPKPFA